MLGHFVLIGVFEFALSHRGSAAFFQLPVSITQQLTTTLFGAMLARYLRPEIGDPITNPNNLPIQLTSFIGREREIAEVKRLHGTTRLLTLTGAGGCGKTRLALHVAAELLGAFPNGIWFVDLAPLSDPKLVPQTVATVLDLQESSTASPSELLRNYLRPKSVLLLLDNCEHLIQACAELTDALLRACPDLKILATSREALNISGESAFRVPSLVLPDAKNLPPLETLSKYEALRLFIDRAQSALPSFTLTDLNAADVTEICERLDGIPLALELAAARVRSLSVEQIRARLDDVFRLLTGGSRTALLRAQTLRATMDWSYLLLTEDERTLFNRLSVFAGGWTVQAAEWICQGDGLETQNVIDLMTRLIDKSLVLAEEQDGPTRYRMLETIRQYAREKLGSSGETSRVHDRHLQFFTRFMEETDPRLRGPDQVILFDRVELEHDNFRAALAWALEGGDVETGLRLAGAWHWFCGTRGYLTEGRSWCGRLLERGATASKPARAIAWRGYGILTWMLGDNPGSEIGFEKSLALYRELGDRSNVAWLLTFLALPADSQGDRDKAKRLNEESLVLYREIGEKWGEAFVLQRFGGYAAVAGDYSLANEIYTASLALTREVGDLRAIARTTGLLATVAILQGDLDKSSDLLKETTISLFRIRDKMSIATFLDQGWGPLANLKGDAKRSTRLFGAADAIVETVGRRGSLANRDRRDSHLKSVRTQLDEATFNSAWNEGRAMSLEQAVEYALQQEPASVAASPTPAQPYPAGLTEREVGVLRLISQGLTDAQVAEKLVISTRTVNSHLRSIYGKIGVNTRTSAARFAADNKLI